MSPTWTILIATLGRRSAKLQGLLKDLLPQVETAGGAVTIEALWNNGERPIGRVRQDLLDGASSQYVSFIDDDDRVSASYVPLILPLLDGVDYIGFKVEVVGSPRIIASHSLKYEGWYEEGDRAYRNVSHLNPIKRSLALLGFFSGTYETYGEDYAWAHQVAPYVQTEHVVDEILYFYTPAGELGNERVLIKLLQDMSGPRHDAAEWPPPGVPFEVSRKEAFLLCGRGDSAHAPRAVYVHRPTGDTGYSRPAIDSPYFGWHPSSSLK